MTLRAISLGWGVQSWTLAAMAALGELEADVAIHADTGWEKAATYEFRAQWEPWLQEHGLLVLTVADYRQSAKVTTAATDIPANVLTNGSAGKLKRQCTGRWKVDPLRRALTQVLLLCDLRKRAGCVESLQGISLDEWHRVRDSDVQWISHRYPLIERRMTRGDCLAWLAAHELPAPPKSACVFCPYTTNGAWQELKRVPADWQVAVAVDLAIRTVRTERAGGELFLHRRCLPLPEAVTIPEDYGMTQSSLLATDGDGCDSGYCFG